MSNNRAVLTINRFDFIGLHRFQPNHAGIIVCSNDMDRNRMATRINEAISALETLGGNLVRVNRPQKLNLKLLVFCQRIRETKVSRTLPRSVGVACR